VALALASSAPLGFFRYGHHKSSSEYEKPVVSLSFGSDKGFIAMNLGAIDLALCSQLHTRHFAPTLGAKESLNNPFGRVFEAQTTRSAWS
jgi:hypothetical protein